MPNFERISDSLNYHLTVEALERGKTSSWRGKVYHSLKEIEEYTPLPFPTRIEGIQLGLILICLIAIILELLGIL